MSTCRPCAPVPQDVGRSREQVGGIISPFVGRIEASCEELLAAVDVVGPAGDDDDVSRETAHCLSFLIVVPAWPDRMPSASASAPIAAGWPVAWTKRRHASTFG